MPTPLHSLIYSFRMSVLLKQVYKKLACIPESDEVERLPSATEVEANTSIGSSFLIKMQSKLVFNLKCAINKFGLGVPGCNF